MIAVTPGERGLRLRAGTGVRTETALTTSSTHDGAEALARLYDLAARPLHRYLSRRVGAEIADDLVAEAFLVLWEQRDRVDLGGAAARPWLYGVATNLLKRHRRGEERRLRAMARAGGRRATADEIDVRVADRADAALLAGAVTGMLTRLRPEERDVLLLSAWADLTPSEIAAALDVPVATVRTRLHRARARLRKAVEGLVVHEREENFNA